MNVKPKEDIFSGLDLINGWNELASLSTEFRPFLLSASTISPPLFKIKQARSQSIKPHDPQEKSLTTQKMDSSRLHIKPIPDLLPKPLSPFLYHQLSNNL